MIDSTGLFIFNATSARFQRIHPVFPSHHLLVYDASQVLKPRCDSWRDTVVLCVDVALACFLEVFRPGVLCDACWKSVVSAGCEYAVITILIPSWEGCATALLTFESVSFGQVILIEHLTVFFTEATRLIRLIKSLR